MSWNDFLINGRKYIDMPLLTNEELHGFFKDIDFVIWSKENTVVIDCLNDRFFLSNDMTDMSLVLINLKKLLQRGVEYTKTETCRGYHPLSNNTVLDIAGYHKILFMLNSVGGSNGEMCRMKLRLRDLTVIIDSEDSNGPLFNMINICQAKKDFYYPLINIVRVNKNTDIVPKLSVSLSIVDGDISTTSIPIAIYESKFNSRFSLVGDVIEHVSKILFMDSTILTNFAMIPNDILRIHISEDVFMLNPDAEGIPDVDLVGRLSIVTEKPLNGFAVIKKRTHGGVIDIYGENTNRMSMFLKDKTTEIDINEKMLDFLKKIPFILERKILNFLGLSVKDIDIDIIADMLWRDYVKNPSMRIDEQYLTGLCALIADSNR